MSFYQLMVVKNIEVVNRELTNLVATEEDDSINFSGTYLLKLKNIGKVPTANLSLEITSLSLNLGGDLLSDKSTGIGRIRSNRTSEVTFDFSTDIDTTTELRTVARTACADSAIAIKSEEKVKGVIQTKSIGVTGGVEVSSEECDLGGVVSIPDPVEPQPQPEPEPEPQPPSGGQDLPEEEPPTNGNNGDGDGGGDNIDDNTEPPEDVSVTLEGPEIVSVGDSKTYNVANPSDVISLYSWESNAGDEQISGEPEYTVEFDDVANEAVSVTATDNQANELASDRLNVVVVGNDQSQARDSDSQIDGLRFVEPNQTATYSWVDFPDGTIQFQWQVLAEEDGANVTIQRSNLAQDRLDLEFTSPDGGNYLIAIGAIGQDGNVIAQAQKQVSVVTTE